MTVLGESIRTARQRLGLSQAQLAEIAGVTQATIAKIEAGQTVRTRFLAEIGRALGVPAADMIDWHNRDAADAAVETSMATVAVRGSRIPASAPPDAAVPQYLTQLPRDQLLGGTDLPVFGTVEGGPGQFIINDEPIDYVARPSPLRYVRDGYGVIVVGESMVPVFRPGDIALVHPHLPPRVNDACVFFSEDPPRATIKEYVAQTEDVWRVRRYQPQEEIFELDKAEWGRAAVVVGKYSRR